MINNIKSFGKFLDQPMLIAKLDKQMPKILCGLGMLYFSKPIFDSFKKSKNASDAEKKTIKQDLFNKSIVLSFSIASALLAPKIASKLLKRAPVDSIKKVNETNKLLIDEFLSKNNCLQKHKKILNKAKNKILNFNDIKALVNEFNSDKEKILFEKIIPSPKNIKAKDIFQEIGYLSVYGAIPVLGGITGGVAADRITDKKHYKEKIPDKINEGLYQYLANIFMCNVGAGAALGILEKLKITSRSARALAMTVGVILTGVIGGSKIANFITKNIVSPILNPSKKKEEIKERTPEPIDLGLHADDIATVSLLSGLKWIEPALPVLYSVSGYRAGIGYRN